MADSTAFANVNKAWIPQSSGGKKLWDNNKAVDDYIKSLDSKWVPAKTIRLSQIAGMAADDLQLVIPSALLNSNKGGLGITVSCKDKLSDLPQSVVNYNTWKSSEKGSH